MTNDSHSSASPNTLNQRLDVDFALQAAGLGVWEVDPITNLVIWDDQCRALFGLDRENQLPYEQAIQYIHPQDVERVNQAVQRAITPASDGLYDQTYRTIGADDGKLRWVRFCGRAYFSPAGKLVRFGGIAQEATQQMQDRQQLEESKTSLQNAIEVGELGTFSVDIATNLLTCSFRVADWFGFDHLTADTEAFIDGVGPDERDYVRSNLLNTIKRGPEGHYNVTHSVINAKTGQRRILHALGRVYFDEQGKPIKLEGIAQDITAQRELQTMLENQVRKRTQELTLANQDLKRSNDNLQQFAYVASHDLQEPLRKIQSFSSLLEQQLAAGLTESSRDYIQRIGSAGARMSTLIKDLLAYSRISTRQQAFGLVSLEAIVADALTTLEEDIARQHAQVIVEDLPVITGDESQLRQLFQNLLSNALKFTPPGQHARVQITSQLCPRGELASQLQPTSDAAFFYQINVRDEGIGFDIKYLDRIFQVFQRLHGKSEFAGTGVGLAICQKVVANHGGAITADSQPGRGSTFCVYLPA